MVNVMYFWKNQKLNREERIGQLQSAINSIKNLRYSIHKTENDKAIVFDSSLKTPLYSWWKIFWDIIIGINIRE